MAAALMSAAHPSGASGPVRQPAPVRVRRAM